VPRNFEDSQEYFELIEDASTMKAGASSICYWHPAHPITWHFFICANTEDHFDRVRESDRIDRETLSRALNLPMALQRWPVHAAMNKVVADRRAASSLLRGVDRHLYVANQRIDRTAARTRRH